MGEQLLSSFVGLVSTVSRGAGYVVDFLIANPLITGVGLLLILTKGKSFSLGNLLKVKG